jgi:hypothetical protein
MYEGGTTKPRRKKERKRRGGRLALRSRPPICKGRGAGQIQSMHEAANNL